jgi:hypothetical protein
LPPGDAGGLAGPADPAHTSQGLQQTSLLGTAQHYRDAVLPGMVNHTVDQR